MDNTLKGFVRTGTSLTVLGFGLKTIKAILTGSATGFLAANSKFMFMSMFPIPNSVIVMIVLIIIGAAYLWHVDINK